MKSHWESTLAGAAHETSNSSEDITGFAIHQPWIEGGSLPLSPFSLSTLELLLTMPLHCCIVGSLIELFLQDMFFVGFAPYVSASCGTIR